LLTYAVVGTRFVMVWRVITCLVKCVDETEVVYSEQVSTDVNLSSLLERRQLVVSQVPDTRQDSLERSFQTTSENFVIRFGTQHHTILLLVCCYCDDADIQLLHQTPTRAVLNVGQHTIHYENTNNSRLIMVTSSVT